MQILWQDVRYGARMLLKQPGFTLIAIAALAISIGANTAIFSAINALLLRPLPVKDIDRLISTFALREGFDPFACSFLEYAAYRDRTHLFSNSGVATQRSFNLIGRAEPERIRGATVMADYLTTLGVKPLLGRAFSANEILARLRPGVTVKQADTELKAIARQLEQEYPNFRRGWSVKAISLRQDLLGDLEGRVRKALFALAGGVGFLLLICCANIANLQLARGVARTRELALRRALGAGRWRLVRQLQIGRAHV